MNYLKRIEIKNRPQHFQQGGNIAIGSPKPYTTTLPGVNFNPLTLNNAPIEINTTGISDQIEKMQRLAYDREVLAFKYKDLEYKEGKDYLDALTEISKSVNGISSTVKNAGGIASISPRFKDIFAQEQSEKAKLMEDINRAIGVKDLKSIQSLTLRSRDIINNPKYLEARTMAGVVDDIFDKANDFGIGTKTIMDKAIRYVQGDPNIDIYGLIKEANYFKALKVSAKDETTFINNFLSRAYDSESEKQVVSIDPKTGLKKTTTTKEMPDLAKVKAAIKSSLTTMQEGRAILEARNINPDKPDSADLDSFVNATVDAYHETQKGKFAPKLEEDVVEKLLPSYADTPEGKAAGAGRNSKNSEAEEDAQDFLSRINDEYGYDAKNKMENIIRTVIKDAPAGEKWTRIEKKLAEDGFQRLDGKQPAAGGEDYPGKSSGVVPKNIGVEDIVKAVKKSNSKIDNQVIRDNTAIGHKDGKTYLVTSNADVKNSIMSLWPKTKIHKENEDDDVVWKDYGIDPSRWDVSGFSVTTPGFIPKIGYSESNTTIFELEDTPKKTSSSYKGSNVDPKEAAKQLNSKGVDNLKKGKFWTAYQDSVAANPDFKVVK